MQEASRAALLGTTRRALTDRQERVYDKMNEAFMARMYMQVVKMAEQGLAVTGEVRRTWPALAAEIHRMLGHSFVERFEFVKGVVPPAAGRARQGD